MKRPNPYQEWFQFISKTRSTMQSLDLEEVETPTLVPGPAFEDSLEPFETKWEVGSQSQVFYLPTSPEIHLKKLLTLGFENIFEIKDSFRNQEWSPIHQPEFKMLEWYRVGKTLEDLKSDIKTLVDNLDSHPSRSWIQLSYAQLFSEVLNLKLEPQTSLEEVLSWAENVGLRIEGRESRIELLNWIYVDQIEPWMREKKNTFIFVDSFPAGANSLAKVSDQGWSNRFELFFEGIEIANAFDELMDPYEHEARWERIQSSRKDRGLKPLGKDLNFFASIRAGLPSCVGIALGLERLFMVLNGYKSLSEFKPFSKKIE